jgi:cholesterol transport system auxiliary component
MIRAIERLGVVALLSLLLGGCALTSKSQPIDVRWFSPERVRPRLTSATTAGTATPLELGRITASAHLREKMVFRDDAWEIGYADDLRWTERPDAYVRRELGRTLFEEGGFRRSVAGDGAPTLEIELVAFEELRAGDARLARVQLRMMLHDGRDVLHEETITVDERLRGSGVEAFVSATAEALDRTTSQVASRAKAVLAR